MHSGEDLQSAAAAVMGYEQVTMKGKAIKVNPVPGVATAKLQSLLDKALDASEALPNEPSVEADAAAAAAAKALGDVKDLMAVRLELMPALARGNDGCANRFRYNHENFP